MAADLKTRNELNDLMVSIYDIIAKSEHESIQHGPYPDLSVTECHTLEAIGRRGPRTMSEVAQKLGVTVATLSVSIKKLCRRGYVCRDSLDSDRRVVLISLTEKGRKAERVHKYFHDVMMKTVLRNMDDDETAALKNALLTLQAYFYEYMGNIK